MFNALINETHVKSIKNDLLHHNRSHKLCTSTQLTEALAFGFGFKTHAALLAHLKCNQTPTTCVNLNEARLWSRLSELRKLSVETLKKAIEIDLSESFSRAIGIRDMRGRIALTSDLEDKLERFFKLMADYGAAYFTVKGTRMPFSAPIAFGGYQRGPQAMRNGFVPSKPGILWQWDANSLSGLLAEDFIEDHAGPDTNLIQWSVEVIDLLEKDLKIGNAVFHAETGLTIHHHEIDGCNKSVIYQRIGQMDDVRAADASVSMSGLMTA